MYLSFSFKKIFWYCFAKMAFFLTYVMWADHKQESAFQFLTGIKIKLWGEVKCVQWIVLYFNNMLIVSANKTSKKKKKKPLNRQKKKKSMKVFWKFCNPVSLYRTCHCKDCSVLHMLFSVLNAIWLLLRLRSLDVHYNVSCVFFAPCVVTKILISNKSLLYSK